MGLKKKEKKEDEKEEEEKEEEAERKLKNYSVRHAAKFNALMQIYIFIRLHHSFTTGHRKGTKKKGD